MTDIVIKSLRDGAWEHGGVNYRGIAARDRCDQDQLEAGLVPVGDWENGERRYRPDAAAQEAARTRAIHEQAVEAWHLRQVAPAMGPAGPRPDPEVVAQNLRDGKAPWTFPTVPEPRPETIEEKVARLEKELGGREPKPLPYSR